MLSLSIASAISFSCGKMKCDSLNVFPLTLQDILHIVLLQMHFLQCSLLMNQDDNSLAYGTTAVLVRFISLFFTKASLFLHQLSRRTKNHLNSINTDISQFFVIDLPLSYLYSIQPSVVDITLIMTTIY